MKTKSSVAYTRIKFRIMLILSLRARQMFDLSQLIPNFSIVVAVQNCYFFIFENEHFERKTKKQSQRCVCCMQVYWKFKVQIVSHESMTNFMPEFGTHWFKKYCVR